MIIGHVAGFFTPREVKLSNYWREKMTLDSDTIAKLSSYK